MKEDSKALKEIKEAIGKSKEDKLRVIFGVIKKERRRRKCQQK